jgi:hypothetical protein
MAMNVEWGEAAELGESGDPAQNFANVSHHRPPWNELLSFRLESRHITC